MPTSTTSFAARLPSSLHKKLKAYAKREELSMNQVLVLATKEYIDESSPLKRIENTVVQTDEKVDQLLQSKSKTKKV